MAIVLPHVFQDNVNETASGVQVNENFNVLKAAIEANENAIAALRTPGFTISEVQVARALATAYTPSTTKSAIVLIIARTGGGDGDMGFVVNGTTVGSQHYRDSQPLMATVPVPVNGKWEAQALSGPFNLLLSTYFLIG